MDTNFPAHITATIGTGEQAGKVDVYFDDEGTASIDACLPAALAIRMLEAIDHRPTALNGKGRG